MPGLPPLSKPRVVFFDPHVEKVMNASIGEDRADFDVNRLYRADEPVSLDAAGSYHGELWNHLLPKKK